MKKARGGSPADARAAAAQSDVDAIVAGRHSNPFAVLGLQEADGVLVARCFIPHAEFVTAYTLAGKPCGELARRDDAGFFEGRLSIRKRQPLK
ncbi:MAG: 1,4-alpha-glucan branching enzyme, partial [Rhizobiaceae bacterium]|nr:1,4-alpha-glucan branching enzyme [Rhizobiaceae bacterium]